MDFDPNKLQLGWEQIPTMGNLYSVIKDLDDMLLENSTELEHCMGNIMECIGDIPPIGKAVNIVGGSGAGGSTGGKDSSAKSTSSQYESIEAAIQSLVSADVLEKNACFVPSQDDVTRVLQHILDSMNRHHTSACAEYEQLFLNLVKLSTQEGFCLPLKPQTSTTVSAQDPTVSSLMDAEEKHNAILWQTICKKFETSFLHNLQNLPLACSSPVKNQLQKRHFLVEALTTLFPMEYVWSKYVAIRTQDLHKICGQVINFNVFRNKVNLTILEDDSFSSSNQTCSQYQGNFSFNIAQFANSLQPFFVKLKIMAEEDEFVILSDVFESRISLPDIFTQVYLSFLEQFLNRVSERIRNNLAFAPNPLQDNIVRLDDKKKRNKKEEKSQQTESAFCEFSNFMESGETMASTNLLTLEELRHLSEIVKAVFLFEDYLSDRTAQLKLDSMPEKETSHKTVKSVLKNRVADCNENVDPYTESDFQKSEKDSALMEDDAAAKYMPPGACSSSQSANSSSAYGTSSKFSNNYSSAGDDHDVGRYLWIRVVLSHLENDLAKSLKAQLCGMSHKLLEDMKANFNAQYTNKSTTVCCDFNFSLTPSAKRIPVQVKSILENYNMTLPFLKICLSVESITTAILDSFISTGKSLLAELNRQVALVPDKTGIEQLYLAFSAAWVTHTFTVHITSVLGEVPLPIKFRSNFVLLQKQFTEFCQLMLQKAKTFQEMSLCSVLQDVDSNNYSSLRNYGEGIASYSNTVQVWHHFMKQQIVQESSRILPSEVTCRLSSHVLRKSLDKWVQRFCSVKPSECRSTQMRADITAVLLHTSSILFNCTDSLKNLIFDEAALMLATEHDDLHAIHSSCNSLLTILLVVCSPLDSLHTAVLDNYPNIAPMSASHSSFSINRELSAETSVMSNEGYMCHWMRYIASKTFPFSRKPITPADFEQPEALLLLGARLAVSSEGVNAITMMTSLLLHDYALPKLILSEAPNFNVPADSAATQKANFASRPSIFCKGLHCVPEMCCLSNAFPVIDLVRPFVTILNSIGYICPDALSTSLLPVMMSSNDVANFLSGQPLKTTGWANIYLLLSPLIKELLQKCLFCLFESSSHNATDPRNNVIPFQDSLGELPCGCRMRNKTNMSLNGPANSYIDSVAETVMEYLSLLSISYFCLSPSLIFLFSEISQLCETNSLPIPNGCLTLYVIARCTIHYLKNQNFLQDEITLGPLKKKELRLIKKFKDCLKNLFCSLDISAQWSAEYSSLYNSVKPKVETLSQRVNKFVRNPKANLAMEKNFSEEVPLSVLEDQLVNGCQLIASSPEGRISFLQVHHIIKNNLDWIEDGMLGRKSEFNRFEIPAMPCTGSMVYYNATVESVVNYEHNYEYLFSIDLGLSKLALKRLLLNRPEFQEEALLSSQQENIEDGATQQNYVKEIRDTLHF